MRPSGTTRTSASQDRLSAGTSLPTLFCLRSVPRLAKRAVASRRPCAIQRRLRRPISMTASHSPLPTPRFWQTRPTTTTRPQAPSRARAAGRIPSPLSRRHRTTTTASTAPRVRTALLIFLHREKRDLRITDTRWSFRPAAARLRETLTIDRALFRLSRCRRFAVGRRWVADLYQPFAALLTGPTAELKLYYQRPSRPNSIRTRAMIAIPSLPGRRARVVWAADGRAWSAFRIPGWSSAESRLRTPPPQHHVQRLKIHAGARVARRILITAQLLSHVCQGRPCPPFQATEEN